MNAYKIDNMTRVSKRAARKLWGKADLSLCPCNLRPGFPWRTNIDVFASDIAKAQTSVWEHERRAADFDNYVQNFEWYNCTCNETGKYTAFYRIDR